jgi:hypothetical protein
LSRASAHIPRGCSGQGPRLPKWPGRGPPIKEEGQRGARSSRPAEPFEGNDPAEPYDVDPAPAHARGGQAVHPGGARPRAAAVRRRLEHVEGRWDRYVLGLAVGGVGQTVTAQARVEERTVDI